MPGYRLISDIHSEFWPDAQTKVRRLADRLLPPLSDDAQTVLLLAGDTGSHRRRNTYGWLTERLCERFERVIDIPGNHFWYGGSDWRRAEPPIELPNYAFGQAFVDGPVVAATLWADFQRGSPIVEEQCRVGMNDFIQIPGLTPRKVKERYAEHVAFLRQHITPGCVVMTHFAPSWQSIPPDFATDPRNGYYASDLEDLILDTRPALWLHGHIHTACDYRIADTRVVCNPAGYTGAEHNPVLTIALP